MSDICKKYAKFREDLDELFKNKHLDQKIGVFLEKIIDNFYEEMENIEESDSEESESSESESSESDSSDTATEYPEIEDIDLEKYNSMLDEKKYLLNIIRSQKNLEITRKRPIVCA